MSVATLPIDYNLIRKTIGKEVERATGKTCILEEQKGQVGEAQPRPALPYFSFKIIVPGAKVGDDSYFLLDPVDPEDEDEVPIFNLGGQRRMTVSFHCYGQDQEEAYNLMALWQMSLGLKLVQERFREAQIAVWTVADIADLTALLNTGYEGRAQLDVMMGIAINITEKPGIIETVEIEGTVGHGSTSEVIEFNVPEEEE